jgi:hypothetical protein
LAEGCSWPENECINWGCDEEEEEEEEGSGGGEQNLFVSAVVPSSRLVSSRSRRHKTSISSVHLEENKLGGLGKEFKSSSAHQSSILAANQEALAPRSPQEEKESKSESPLTVESSQGISLLSESSRGVAVNGEVVEKVSILNPGVKVSEPAAPSWTSFQQNQAVRKFLNHLVAVRIFSLSGVKRAMHMYLMETNSMQTPLGILKPNGLHVRELFDPKMCQSGKEMLSKSRQPLCVEEADRHHIFACDLCGAAKAVQAECYFSKLRLCLTHGWRPEIDRDNIREMYQVSGNYLSVDLFQITASKEFDKMCDSGALLPVAEGTVGIVTPLGALIKSSDKLRTRVLTGISIVDQQSLTQANIRLLELGYPAIKARLTTDVTAT